MGIPQSNNKPTMETKLNRISEMARQNGKEKFTNLCHLLNEVNLEESFYLLKKGKACGIDGVSWEEYEKDLKANLSDLVERMKRQAYKPQPVKRGYIEKANGKQRPLGLPCVEDKVVQKCVSRILGSIYENDFLPFSYGYRPGNGCHLALKRLNEIIMRRPVSYVIDADIKGFFDNLDHEWLKKFLGVRIGDRNLLRILTRFLKAGIMENGQWETMEKGTPQGGVISPLLANLYLHQVLDLWIEKVIKRRYRGVVEIVRYADDFVICVENREEAEKLLTELRERFRKFGLELSEEKTRLIEFRNGGGKRGPGRETFDFLGFTHYLGKTRKGKYLVTRKTSRKKLNAKINEIYLWFKKIRSFVELRECWPVIAAKLRGHYQYYGISGNTRGIRNYHRAMIKIIYKWINRRSQKKSMNWDQFNVYLAKYPLPRPRITFKLYSLRSC
jgi:RNA-directed DNA polymerase